VRWISTSWSSIPGRCKAPAACRPSSAARVWTVELVRDRQTKEPLVPIGATGVANAPMATFVRHVLAVVWSLSFWAIASMSRHRST